MDKKNNEMRRLIERKHELIKTIQKDQEELKELQKTIQKWSFEQTGAIMYEYMKQLCFDLMRGKRPVSANEAIQGCEFEEIDRDRIRLFAQGEAAKQRIDEQNWFNHYQLKTLNHKKLKSRASKEWKHPQEWVDE